MVSERSCYSHFYWYFLMGCFLYFYSLLFSYLFIFLSSYSLLFSFFLLLRDLSYLPTVCYSSFYLFYCFRYFATYYLVWYTFFLRILRIFLYSFLQTYPAAVVTCFSVVCLRVTFYSFSFSLSPLSHSTFPFPIGYYLKVNYWRVKLFSSHS